MTIKILLDRRRDVRLVQLICLAAGARSSGAAFEQLVDQLFEARRGSAEIVEKFAAEVDALRRELAAERTKRAELQVLAEWPSDRARVQ